jgi:hydrogenase maturation protein HypF
VDARNDAAVVELRKRKHRNEKPLALMFPSLASVEDVCEVGDLEQRLLLSPQSPIVLLKRRSVADPISAGVAPGNPYLGAMLAYTPLHHLLMAELNTPVVATSGNLSDEPICIDEHEALDRLSGIADLFLVHNRPIERHVDDSIVRVMAERESVVRRARGYAPLPVPLEMGAATTTIAVGAHLKNSVALSVGKNAFVSQHVGDLETGEAFAAFRRVIGSFEKLYCAAPECVAHDAHPDYLSTNWAESSRLPRVAVQHHYAHVLSCMAENEVSPPALGIAWDGTGYGLDGTIWGGEFLQIGQTGFRRVAHLRTFALPGGEQAVREPRRSAIGLLYSIFGERVFDMRELLPVIAFMPSEIFIIKRMFERDLNSPSTSSAGRLFDAVASIVGLRQRQQFEGQAAMELEFLADAAEDEIYPFDILHRDGLPASIDWQPMIEGIIKDTNGGARPSHISAKFHNTLAEMMVAAARSAGEKSIVLSGGCFQNKYLTERAIKRLRQEQFNVYWHQRVPTNDGGIALGQLAAAAIRDIDEPAAERRSIEIVCA